MLTLRSRAGLCMLSLWVAALAIANPAHAATTAFVGVNVISVEAGGVLENQTVVVEDDRIVAMGARASVVVPEKAQTIGGSGKYLVAGLTDVHVHFPTDDFLSSLMKKEVELQPLETMLFPFLANGVTTVRVMAGFPELLALRDRIDRGEVLGPRLIVCTPMFDGTRSIWPAPLGRAIGSPEDARRAVRESKAAGYDLIKVYSLIAPDAYDAMMDEAKKVGLKVVGHVPVRVGLDHAFAAGQHEITHVEEFWRFTADYSDRGGSAFHQDDCRRGYVVFTDAHHLQKRSKAVRRCRRHAVAGSDSVYGPSRRRVVGTTAQSFRRRE